MTAQQAALAVTLTQLKAGQPLPYVLGHWEFYGLDFELTSATLIPRPETELLVEQALAWLRVHPGCRRGLDVGTGSGCIAVTLAVQVTDIQMTACDLSLKALQVAQDNARRHNVVGRLHLVQSDLATALRGPFDLICTNLPYIPTAILETLSVARSEPWLALDGGLDGLDVVRRLLATAPRLLATGGLLLMEIEASQGALAGELVRLVFPGAEVRVRRDLAGRERVIEVQS
jgi:release factor glutamine methyltransferase